MDEYIYIVINAIAI